MMTDFKHYLDKSGEIGYVEQAMHSIVYANGLPGARPREVVLFETGEVGQVLSLTPDYVEILIFSKATIRVGTKVARTDKLLEVKIGDGLLGNTVDALGRINGRELVSGNDHQMRQVDVTPLGMNVRKNIDKPFETGVTLIDLIVPLGKGQRELVVGNRKTGKTQLLLQTTLTQAQKGTICVYAAIAKKRLDIKMIEEFVKKKGISEKTVIVASSSADPPGLVFITPYTAMTIAEYFRDKGMDVFVVLDDLSAHAKYYREITLLARRFPGRSSYPGDIFYIHSRLLERAGNFLIGNREQGIGNRNKELGIKNNKTNIRQSEAPPSLGAQRAGGQRPMADVQKKEVSITCLSVAELVLSDLSGFIQTNLMAMTDGHIYYDSSLYNQGRRPAINAFLSVTRVGRQAQTPLLRDLNRQVTSFLVYLEKLREFMHFGAELSESTKRTIAMGDRVLTFFDQSTDEIIPVNINIVLLSGLWGGLWKATAVNKMKEQMQGIISAYKKDKEFKSKIDNLVNSSKSFADLVGSVKNDESLLVGRTRRQEQRV